MLRRLSGVVCKRDASFSFSSPMQVDNVTNVIFASFGNPMLHSTGDLSHLYGERTLGAPLQADDTDVTLAMCQ